MKKARIFRAFFIYGNLEFNALNGLVKKYFFHFLHFH
jgi:hypothetical protein